MNLFHANILPEVHAKPVGYIALISKYNLRIPPPDSICAIGEKHKKYEKDQWQVFTPRHEPEDTLYGHLTFALKHEGIDLAVLKALYDRTDPAEIVKIVQTEPTGAYSRRIWFLYEWLLNEKLDIPDVSQGNFVFLVNTKIQYAGSPIRSRRHHIFNNLPGRQGFCPLIKRTRKLDYYIDLNLSQKAEEYIGRTHKDLISRAAKFLELEDSRASYKIEGESPPHNRIERWGKIIGEAGLKPLTLVEFEYLQSIVITDMRFTMPGLRVKGGFIGDHDRVTHMPMPVHISARPEDLLKLLSGLLETYELLKEGDFNQVLLASMIAFGFVFIHPFEDGNGRIHRYLFHHILAETLFVPRGIVFPVSAVIEVRLDEYKQVLKAFSIPRLEYIKWAPTEENNVRVTNETIDLYRYFDATKQAEFLFACVEETVNKTLPNEVAYLKAYDRFKGFIKSYIDMPDGKVNLLIKFLKQNDGVISKRARENEFKEFIELTDIEAHDIESKYAEFMQDNELG